MVANLNDASITLENNDVKTPADKTRPYRSIHSPFSVIQSDLKAAAHGWRSLHRLEKESLPQFESPFPYLQQHRHCIQIFWEHSGQAKLTRGTAPQSSASRYNSSCRPINRVAAASSEYRYGSQRRTRARENNLHRRDGECPYRDRW